MKRIILGRGARAELRIAGAYYENERENLSLEFAAEIERALDLLQQNPFVGSPYRVEPFRRYVLNRFPFNLFYVVKSDVIYVVAVAHHKRKPDYWTDRKF